MQLSAKYMWSILILANAVQMVPAKEISGPDWFDKYNLRVADSRSRSGFAVSEWMKAHAVRLVDT